MSATPIPRTLALIIYGDLDISIMNERPPGRQEVDTFLIGEDKRERMQGFIRRQVQLSLIHIWCALSRIGQLDPASGPGEISRTVPLPRHGGTVSLVSPPGGAGRLQPVARDAMEFSAG